MKFNNFKSTIINILASKNPHFLLIVFLFFIFIPQNTHAYLDPGIGNVFIQLFASIMIGVGFAIKIFWGSIKTLFINIFSRKPKNKEEEKDEEISNP